MHDLLGTDACVHACVHANYSKSDEQYRSSCLWPPEAYRESTLRWRDSTRRVIAAVTQAFGGGGSGATVNAIGSSAYAICAGATREVAGRSEVTVDGSAAAAHPATAGQQFVAGEPCGCCCWRWCFWSGASDCSVAAALQCESPCPAPAPVPCCPIDMQDVPTPVNVGISKTLSRIRTMWRAMADNLVGST
jgi:hypothetical protein